LGKSSGSGIGVGIGVAGGVSWCGSSWFTSSGRGRGGWLTSFSRGRWVQIRGLIDVLQSVGTFSHDFYITFQVSVLTIQSELVAHLESEGVVLEALLLSVGAVQDSLDVFISQFFMGIIFWGGALILGLPEVSNRVEYSVGKGSEGEYGTAISNDFVARILVQ
jgi:hypothetical protein